MNYKYSVIFIVDLGMEEDEEEAIPLPNVNAAILKKVIQWCTYHKDDPPPPEDDENKEKRTDDIGTWDMEFLKVDQGTLFELILVRITNFIKFALLFLIHISFKKYVTALLFAFRSIRSFKINCIDFIAKVYCRFLFIISMYKCS